MVSVLIVALLMKSSHVTLGADTQPSCANKDGQPEGSCGVPEEDSTDSTNLLQTNADIKRHDTKAEAHNKAEQKQHLVAILSRVFKSVDADQSGDLNESEIQAVSKFDPKAYELFKAQLPVLEDSNWWHKYDVNKDGRLSRDEWQIATDIDAKTVSSILEQAQKSGHSLDMDAEAKLPPNDVDSNTNSEGQIVGLLEEVLDEEEVDGEELDSALGRKGSRRRAPTPWAPCAGFPTGKRCGTKGSVAGPCPSGYKYCYSGEGCACQNGCNGSGCSKSACRSQCNTFGR